MFKKIKKGLRGSIRKEEDDDSDDINDIPATPFSFDNDPYPYPCLYEEADEMLQAALLIYTMTDLRSLAKKKNTNLVNPEQILTLPLALGTCLEMIQDNLEVIQAEIGDSDHQMTMSALTSIQQRYDNQEMTTSGHWASPFGSMESVLQPSLIAYGDENPDSDLVYAVGIDPIRRRVTVAFRGSVTPSDFLTDASITLNRQENPMEDQEEEQADKIGIHNGFVRYLLKEKKGKENNKFDEIMKHVIELFQDDERKATYKLYVTGHSLGGALATLFSFYAAASTDDDDVCIPKPVTCVSVASPRVGEGSFQRAFTLLEKQGKLRHLRIANHGDPVAIMPKSSSKKLFAMLSPVSYVAFKLTDQDFTDKETYKHTGMKLKLRKDGGYEIAYSNVNSKEETGDTEVVSSKSRFSFNKKDLPGVANHFGNVYCENLVRVKDDLASITLNELYQSKAAATLLSSPSEQSEEQEADDEST